VSFAHNSNPSLRNNPPTLRLRRPQVTPTNTVPDEVFEFFSNYLSDDNTTVERCSCTNTDQEWQGGEHLKSTDTETGFASCFYVDTITRTTIILNVVAIGEDADQWPSEAIRTAAEAGRIVGQCLTGCRIDDETQSVYACSHHEAEIAKLA
jgi:hypothetical protein